MLQESERTHPRKRAQQQVVQRHAAYHAANQRRSARLPSADQAEGDVCRVHEQKAARERDQQLDVVVEHEFIRGADMRRPEFSIYLPFEWFCFKLDNQVTTKNQVTNQPDEIAQVNSDCEKQTDNA